MGTWRERSGFSDGAGPQARRAERGKALRLRRHMAKGEDRMVASVRTL